MFRFNNPAAIFTVGDSNLKEGFTDILTDFFPRYLKVLDNYKENIQEVRIEGHTSSEYSTAKNDQERYDLNKELSIKRATTVRDYAVNTVSDENKQWVEETFKPHGMAYENLIYNPDGTENKVASRRVDFKIVQKEQ
jgi:outer membrane protein OmpA-like peptidoglycan-associated protein